MDTQQDATKSIISLFVANRYCKKLLCYQKIIENTCTMVKSFIQEWDIYYVIIQVVTLQFNSFRTHDSNDYLEIKEDSSSSALYTLYGNQDNHGDITLTDNTAFLSFRTNGGGQTSGFNITYICVWLVTWYLQSKQKVSWRLSTEFLWGLDKFQIPECTKVQIFPKGPVTMLILPPTWNLATAVSGISGWR